MKWKLCIILLLCLLSLMNTFESEGQEIEPLIKQLMDENSDVRHRAETALVRIGEPAVPALIKALSDEDGWIRLNAAEALGFIGEPAQAAVPALIKVLSDENKTVVMNAAWALGLIGEPAQAAVPALIEALSDGIGILAATALSKIGKPAVPALIKTLGSEKEVVRSNAAYALASIETPEARKASIEAVPTLILALSNEGEVHNSTINALFQIGTPEARKALGEYEKQHPTMVYGNIVDTEKQRPIKGVRVVIVGVVGTEHEIITDSRGDYEIVGLPAAGSRQSPKGRYLISIYRDGYHDRVGKPMTVYPGGKHYVSMRMTKKHSKWFLLIPSAMWLGFFGGSVFWIWMFIDCVVKSPGGENIKVLWAILIAFAPLIGAAIYYFVKRPAHLTKATGDKKRPRGVSVVAWILIVPQGVAMSAVLSMNVYIPTLPQELQVAFKEGWTLLPGVRTGVFFVMSTIGLALGITILRGINRGRLIYLWGNPILLVFSWLLVGFQLMSLPSVILYVLFLVLLTRAKALAFFGSEISDNDSGQVVPDVEREIQEYRRSRNK